MVCCDAFFIPRASVVGALSARDLDDATCKRLFLTLTDAFAVAPLDRLSHYSAAPAVDPE